MFCNCTSDPVRLIYYGYFASTPTRPQTAFSIPLVQLHHQIWQFSTISATAMMEAIVAFHDSRSKERLTVRTGKYTSRNLRRPFTQAIDLHRRILTLQSKIHDDLLEVRTVDKWAAKCPRCFGPSHGEYKESPDEPDVILAMDGNFQQRHQIHASKDTPLDSDYPTSFLPPAEIEKSASTLQQSENQVKDLKTACSDSHTAANDVRNSTSWDRCDDTGLFAAACRHDVPLKFVNIYQSGEKLYYPVAILDHLLTQLPGKKFGVLYDIGCHLKVHIQKRNLLSKHEGRLSYATSVFHAYAHQWRCQIFFNPRFIALFGLSDGEGLERVWSHLSNLVSALRISTRLHRLLSIHWRAAFFSQKTTEGSGMWLMRRLENALEVLSQSRATLQQLEVVRSTSHPERRYTEEFFRIQWQLERAAYTTEKVTEHEMQLALARLLCLEEELDNFWRAPGLQLSPEQALIRLQTQQKLEASFMEQRAKIGRTDTIRLSNDAAENKQLLKVWYSKYDVRVKYLALCAEKRPLEDSRVPGKKSKLGTHGKTALLAALRKHAAKLFQAVKTYNQRLYEFKNRFPNSNFTPGLMVYSDLFKMDSDDEFWNDGLFTNAGEPWATDRHTQQGMRQLAYKERALEEIRRIGWEVRRSMRWATQRYQQLFDIVHDFYVNDDLILNPPEGSAIERLLEHPTFQVLRRWDQPTAAAALFYNHFTAHIHLMELWDADFLNVFAQTPRQEGDIPLLHKWNFQMQCIRRFHKDHRISWVLGDYLNFVESHPLAATEEPPEFINHEEEEEEDIGDEEDEEDQWIKTLDDEALRLVLHADGLESNENVGPE
ncbi:hypothetical protein DFH28DRAFT_21067 [Melampsora americana]|nr:hypothetical protein DFH28DRAFT_21067 [Melampsora americana]